MSPKSIVLISNLYPNAIEPTKGLFIKQLAESLASRAKLSVIAPIPYDPLARFKKAKTIPYKEKNNGIVIYHPRYLVIPKLFRSFTGFFLYLGIRSTLKRLVKQGQADIFSAHWVYPDGFGALLAAKELRRPIAIHALGCDINEYTRFWLRRLLIRYTLHNSDINIVKSQSLKNNITQLGIAPEKTLVVHNGVDQNVFKPLLKADARQSLGLDPVKKYVLFVGNFQIEKGLENLIRAIDLVNSEDFELLVIGSGPLEKQIRKLIIDINISHKVKLLGRIAHRQIPAYLSAVDLLCLPSLREGCPNIVLESLSCGTPVVATRVGAVPDIITSSSFGTIVDESSPKALAEGLTKGLNLRGEESLAFHWYSWDENAQVVHSIMARLRFE